MKILQIVSRLPSPPKDGGAIYVYQTSKSLAREGHNVTIAGFKSNLIDQDVDDLLTFAKVCHTDGKFKPYGFWSILRSVLILKPVTVSHRMNKKIFAKLLDELPTDIEAIFLEGLQVGEFTKQLRLKYPNVPIILRQVNAEHILLRRNASASEKLTEKLVFYTQSFLMKKFEKRVLKMVDGVTSISEKDIKHFKKLVPDQKYVSSFPGIEIPVSIKSDPREGNLFLALASWTWKPNIDGLKWFLVNAWPKISESLPNVKFIVAGKGVPEEMVKAFASDRVSFAGYVDNAEVLRQRATCMIAPLFSGSGIKIKILESFASKLPVITTSIGVEGIDVSPGKHFMQFDDVESCVRTVVELFESDSLRSAIASNAFEYAQNQRWENRTEELVAFARSLAKN